MKNLILIFLATLTLSCCNKDDDKTPIEQLPPATTTGANTAGCLVNGQAFLPKGSSQFGPTLSCFYQQHQDGYHFGLGIVEKGSNEKQNWSDFETSALFKIAPEAVTFAINVKVLVDGYTVTPFLFFNFFMLCAVLSLLL